MGEDINLIAEVGGSPLDMAASNGHLDVVRCLLEKGAKIDLSSPVTNPLFGAIYEGHDRIVNFLLGAGIDPHIVYRGESGKLKNALSFALHYGQTKIAELLKAAGCQLPVEGVDAAVDEPTAWNESAHPAHDAIIAAISAKFGPVDPLSLQEVMSVDGQVHITVHLIRPTPQHPYITLFTTGMSDRPMEVPSGQEAYQYAELLLHLPADWPVGPGAKITQEHRWPMQWLRNVAYFPHQHVTWLGGRHTIMASDEPPAPLGPNTRQSCLLLLADFGNWSPPVLADGKSVRTYTIIPIYTEERDFELKHGIGSLLQRFEAFEITPIVDVKRKNVAIE